MRCSLVGLLLAALVAVGCDGKTSQTTPKAPEPPPLTQEQLIEKAFINSARDFVDFVKRERDSLNDDPFGERAAELQKRLNVMIKYLPEIRFNKDLSSIRTNMTFIPEHCRLIREAKKDLAQLSAQKFAADRQFFIDIADKEIKYIDRDIGSVTQKIEEYTSESKPIPHL